MQSVRRPSDTKPGAFSHERRLGLKTESPPPGQGDGPLASFRCPGGAYAGRAGAKLCFGKRVPAFSPDKRNNWVGSEGTQQLGNGSPLMGNNQKLIEADSAERLANLVSYAPDKRKLRAQAAKLREEVAQERAPALGRRCD